MTKKQKKWLCLSLFFLFLILFAALCIKKHKGIVNTFFKLTGIEAPYEWKAYTKKKYGSYEQIVKTNADMAETIVISENDQDSASIETAIPKEETFVSSSLEIDAMVQAELDSGFYTFEEPLVILNPYKISPLTALVLFSSDQEVRVRMTVKGKTEAADISFTSEAAYAHRIPVIGLYADMENTVNLELLDSDGNVLKEQTISIQTEGMPDYFTDILLPESQTVPGAFPLTVVSGQSSHYPFAYDYAGDIRWYLEKQTSIYGVYPLSDGRICLQDTVGYIPSTNKPQSTNLYEMDYLGRAYTLYYVSNGSHHEVIEKEPGGNLLTLTTSNEIHYEDEILELDRTTGAIVNHMNLAEIFGDTYVNKNDWAHLNTVSYNAEDDSIVISARNLHSVIKINWSTHELVWILCDSRFWEGTEFESYVLTPQGEITYHFMQHAAYPISADLDNNPDTMEITVFDNHQDSSRKVEWFDNKDYSYSIVYSVDESQGTVTQLKRFPAPYSRITSNTIFDEESNHIFSMCGTLGDPDSFGRQGMICETDYETGETINQYSTKYTYYRAFEMQINYPDLCSSLETDENYIKGVLRPVVLTRKKVSVPSTILTDGVSFRLMGKVLYMKALDHQVAQVLFKGTSHTYVFDYTSTWQFSKDYQDYEEDMPIPLSNLEADTYEILVVYNDLFYQTGESFTILP